MTNSRPIPQRCVPAPRPTRARTCVWLIMLLTAGLFWGTGNVANKTVLDHIGPLTAVGLRCLIAALVVVPLALRETVRSQQPTDPRWIRSALPVCLCFAGAASVQQVAFQMTSVTNASFLVNTCTILTPIFAWIALGHRPAGWILSAVVTTIAGAFLMSDGSSSAPFAAGDALCLLSAAFYAAWMVALGHHATTAGRPYLTCLLQFSVAAAVLIFIACLTERPAPGALRAAWPELAYLGIVATAGAFVLQTIAQKHVPPSSAAVVVSSESVFGAIGAWIVLGERTGSAGLAGAGLILAGILIAAGGYARDGLRSRATMLDALRRPALPSDSPRPRGQAAAKSPAQAA